MVRPSVAVKRSMIFIHRWLGVALSVLFMLWFVSGIFMMYWDYPGVGAADRISRSPVLDPAKIKISPEEAYAKATGGETPLEEPSSQRRAGNRGGRGGADGMRLNSFDGRPVYRFRAGRGEYIVYADTGEEQVIVDRPMMDRVAAAWTGQPVSSANVEENNEEDQWTVAGNFRDLRPMLKYSFPNGEEVYISENNGEVVQYTTTASRLGAWVGAIPHWLYFTPLRKHQPEWSKFVIWSSGISTVASIIGIAVGIWMLSPAKKYRFAGQPTSIPYKGQKRWHTILGLAFGILTATWAFSGMLSMGVIPNRGPANTAKGKGKGGPPAVSIPQALRGGRFQLSAFAAKLPSEALRQLAGFPVKELEFTTFAGDPVYIATDGDRRSRIVPMNAEPMDEFDRDRIMNIVKLASPQGSIAELRVMDEYDRYYLDRRGRRPLPVIYARTTEPDETRYYIDPKSGRVVQQYNSRGWINRWLYHGLHSLDFPWLYKYRPLWDIVVIALMLGCTALCVTSIVLTWRVLKRKFWPSFTVVLARKDPAPDAV